MSTNYFNPPRSDPQTGGQIVKSRDRKRIGRNLRESGQQKKNGINEVKKKWTMRIGMGGVETGNGGTVDASDADK